MDLHSEFHHLLSSFSLALTFASTSPSVYIVYRGISATDDCGQTLGSTTTSLTLSFAPKDVTTFSNHQEGGYTYKTIDYATLWSNCSERYTYSSVSGPPCAKTITTEEASCDTQISTIGKEALFWREHCYPQLSFPPTARLQGINTAWKQCDMGNVDTSIIGVFDPPRALRPGTAMVAPAPTQTPSLPDPAIAAPASQILPPQPEKTSSPNDPKASSDAPGKQGPGSVPQAAQPNYGGSPEPASGGATPATMTKSVDPKPGVDSQSNLPAPLYPPTINESPSDPNNESPGMMSALHQALGSDPAPSPQNQPAAAPNGVSQPETGNDENAPVPAPNQLVSDRPAPDQVGTDQSVTNKPPVNRPVISQPSPDQPVANQPTVNQDSVHQPGSNQPANPPQEVGSKENSPATGDIYSPEGSLSNAGASKDTAKGNSQTNPYSGSSYVPEIGPIDDNPEAGVSAHGQNSDSSLDGISNNGGLPPNPAPVIQGSQPGNPALAALPPPQFTVPVENGKTLLGAIINLSSVILAGSSGGATIQAGASPTQVLGHTVSVDPAASKIVINGQEHGLPTQDLSGPNYHDSSNNYDGVITPGSGPDIPVSGASQNQPVAQPNFPALQQNNGGQAPSAVVAGAPAVPLTTIIGNHVVAAISSAPNAILIDGQTISHGSNPITIANTPVAYQANGDLVFGTFTISNIIPAIAPPLPSPPFTTSIANHAIAAIPSSPNAILVDGQIISHGAASVTLFGTPVAYKPNGDLVLGSTTFTSVTPPAVFASTSPTAPAVFTINGQAATILPNNAGVEIAGTTLLANAPPISISGAVSASYGSAGLVVGTSTVKPPQSLFAALKSPDALTSITLAGQVFTYAVSQTAITSSGSSGVILGTSAVAYTSTAPDGAAIIGSSSILYTSSLPALPSATQNVGNLIQSGLNRSGLGNKGSGTVNIAQGSATGVITTGVNTHRPASGMGSVSKRVHVLVGTLAAIVGFSWGCT